VIHHALLVPLLARSVARARACRCPRRARLSRTRLSRAWWITPLRERRGRWWKFIKPWARPDGWAERDHEFSQKPV